MQNDGTAHLQLPLPHKDNLLEDDVFRLREALTLLDTTLQNIAGTLASDDPNLNNVQKMVTTLKNNATSLTQLQLSKASAEEMAKALQTVNSSITQAQKAADTAKKAADGAQGTANAASTAAGTAQTAATAANKAAGTAQGTADAAQIAADTANSAAGAAQKTANTAKTTADSALAKANTVAGGVTIIQKWSSGANFYRKWSDGWIEQGGVVITSGGELGLTTNFYTAFSNTNYIIVGNAIELNSTYYDPQAYNVGFKSLTRTSFVWRTANYEGLGYNKPGTWYACGF